MPSLIDRFMPEADVRERHETAVRAPAAVVLDVARRLDLWSVPVVRAIFWLREKLMGARGGGRPEGPAGLVPQTLAIGWGVLADEPGRLFIAGAACRPWEADVRFVPVPPEEFVAYREPDRVKIVWTLEAEPLGPARTRFATETRARATDDRARAKFRRYWRWARFGIVAIRLLLVPAVRREAERRWQAARAAGVSPDRPQGPTGAR
jgi:hypothetical protein